MNTALVCLEAHTNSICHIMSNLSSLSSEVAPRTLNYQGQYTDAVPVRPPSGSWNAPIQPLIISNYYYYKSTTTHPLDQIFFLSVRQVSISLLVNGSSSFCLHGICRTKRGHCSSPSLSRNLNLVLFFFFCLFLDSEVKVLGNVAPIDVPFMLL